MIELVRDLRTINVLAKFENDPWKIMDVRVLTGLVCPAARPPVRPPARPPARGTTIPRSLKGCGVKSHQYQYTEGQRQNKFDIFFAVNLNSWLMK